MGVPKRGVMPGFDRWWQHPLSHVTEPPPPLRTIINIHHVRSPFAEVVSYSVPKYCHNGRRGGGEHCWATFGSCGCSGVGGGWN